MRSSLGRIVGSVALLLVVVGWFTFASATGSGSIVAGKKKDFSADALFHTIVRMKGLGSIQAQCEPSAPALTIRYHNSSRQTVILAGDKSGSPVADEVAAGADHDEGASISVIQAFHYQLSQVTGAKKPQSFVVISTRMGSSECLSATVSAIATSP